jgi:hypothetical protein
MWWCIIQVTAMTAGRHDEAMKLMCSMMHHKHGDYPVELCVDQLIADHVACKRNSGTFIMGFMLFQFANRENKPSLNGLKNHSRIEKYKSTKILKIYSKLIHIPLFP